MSPWGSPPCHSLAEGYCSSFALSHSAEHQCSQGPGLAQNVEWGLHASDRGLIGIRPGSVNHPLFGLSDTDSPASPLVESFPVLTLMTMEDQRHSFGIWETGPGNIL